MAAVFEPDGPVTSVHIEGLAALKIVKHCQESLPQMVTGSLLGLTVGNGVLEITHAFPFPESDKSAANNNTNTDAKTTAGDDEAADDLAAMGGHEFQLEMMKMLREVNVDNNCVGWYQCMYLGSYSTAALVENQLSYQTDLSPNAVVLLYDPMQTAHGNLVLKCYKLTKATVELRASGKNDYVNPQDIFEEIPVVFSQPGLVKALLHDLRDGRHGAYDGTDGGGLDCTFDRLDLSTNPYLEKHLEFLCTWVDDLASEQLKFQFYQRNLSRNQRYEKKNKDNGEKTNEAAAKTTAEGWASSDAPRRMESLLISNQIRSYCNQVDKFAGSGFGKLFLAGGFHKDNHNNSTTNTGATPPAATSV